MMCVTEEEEKQKNDQKEEGKSVLLWFDSVRVVVKDF